MRRIWIAALAICLAGAGLAQAQEAQPELTQAVRLTYKFKPGKLTRQKMILKGELMMGGQEGQGIPMVMDMSMLLTQKVLGVSKGVGTLVMTPGAMNMNMNFMGQQVQLKTVSGKPVMFLNGQKQVMGASGSGMPGMDAITGMGEVGKPITLKMTPQGKVTGAAAPGGQSFAGGSNLTLPDRPVAPGDKWEETQAMAIPGLPGGGRTEMTATNTLKSLEMKDGRQVATIETEGAVAGAFTMNYSGTTTFDVTNGEVIKTVGGAELDLDLSGILQGLGAQGGAPPPGMPGMRIKGLMNITMATLPPAVPAKKPAARKR